ncbi:alpha/beta fold hydrolase [Micrococcus antarcticus]
MRVAPKSRIPLFMVHGNGVDHRILKPLEAELANAQIFDLHYVDLPGFGTCPPLGNPGGLPELANWLEELIRQTAGEGPFALLGNSLGALLCQEMADRFPGQTQGLFLLAPVVFPDASRRTVPEAQVVVEDPGLLARIDPRQAQQFSDIAVVQSQQAWHSFAQWVLPGLDCANLRSMAKLSKRYFLDPLPVERKRQLDIPVTILCGKQDHITGYRDPEQLSRRYPSMRIRVLDSAGHNVHLEQPEQAAAELRDWAHRTGRMNEPA